MSFLSPFMLALGGLAAAVAVALHLLTTRRPPKALLPTARFIPVSEARAVSRSERPTELPLLASRVLVALLLGAAFARPVLDAPGPSVRSVVMLDVSSNVAVPDAAIGLAAERLTEGGALVVFDTVARALDEDSVAARIAEGKRGAAAGVTAVTGARAASRTSPRASRGIISAALVSATREARRVARGADSVRLVLVSPLAEEEFDAATGALRAEWPGAIEVVRVAAVTDSARGVPVRLVSPLADDPLAPALVRLSGARGAQEVRVVRTDPSAADTAWARDMGRDAGRDVMRSVGREVGRVLVHWPSSGDEPAGADGVTAFGLREATLVAPLARLSIDTTGPSRVVARWRDGAVAAVESPLGEGCVRRVGVGLPLAGDVTLRAPFERFLAVMVEPCGGARGAAVSDSVAQRFGGGTQAASATRLAAGASADPRITALLMTLALAALAAEWMIRRRGAA